jgi:outer membrane protein OmpA-like peptidoglycan-associated protein
MILDTAAAVADQGLGDAGAAAAATGQRTELPSTVAAETAVTEPVTPQPETETSTETPAADAPLVAHEPRSEPRSKPGPGAEPAATPTGENSTGDQPQAATPETLEARLMALGLQPQRTADGAIKLILAREILFSTKGIEIAPQAYAAVEQLIQALAGRPGLQLRVVGHTDDSGSADYNAGLSLLRAKAFAARLTAGGVAAERITSEGRGERELLTRRAQGGVPARQVNRRIELFIRDPGRP